MCLSEQTLQWLALGLTPGLGPTRVRHLVEHFGNVAAIFPTVPHGTGGDWTAGRISAIPGTGKSLELAPEELGKASAAGAHIVPLDDPEHPQHLKQIYDPPLLLYVRGDVRGRSQSGIAVVGMRHPAPYGLVSVCRSIWLRMDSPSSAEWRVALTPPPTAVRSQRKARRSLFLVQA